MQPAAWERLVDLYAPLVRHWCRQKGLSSEDTADVFQEAFQAVAKNVTNFRRDRPGDTFRGWIRAITINKINDHFRRSRGLSDAEGGTAAQIRIAATQDPVSEADESEEIEIVRQSIVRTLDTIRDDFGSRTWDAFWKCQIEEVPTDVVAEELAMTSAAVRKAKYRVLRRLREELEGLID